MDHMRIHHQEEYNTVVVHQRKYLSVLTVTVRRSSLSPDTLTLRVSVVFIHEALPLVRNIRLDRLLTCTFKRRCYCPWYPSKLQQTNQKKKMRPPQNGRKNKQPTLGCALRESDGLFKLAHAMTQLLQPVVEPQVTLSADGPTCNDDSAVSGARY